MIHSIEINDFRALKNVNIKLGKYITAISGRNGLGKSTILALLGNACELKIKEGKTLFNTQFRTEFSEVFKASKTFDLSGSNKCKINFSEAEKPETIVETKVCRVSWQNNGTRFRIIPETITKDEKNSKKKEWPSIYLGLSRLYPIGEVNDESISVKEFKFTSEEEKYFIDNYLEILNLKTQNKIESEICVDMIDIGKTTRKKGIGISTPNYESITNSAGQDNIGQIIMAILSFERLSVNSNYKGGLLLIDEIEATLHPVAQIKLVNFLYKACKKLSLQVVFTSHSVSLLKELSIKILHNSKDTNNYEIYYLSKGNGPLVTYKNPSFSAIQNDLTLAPAGSNIKKITVYSEDDEGRWFFEKLVQKYSLYLDVVRTKLSCDILLQLNKNDPKYFSNVIIVVDGDVSDGNIEKANISGNLIKIPGSFRPEEVIYNFLMDLDSDSEIFGIGFEIGFSKESIIENGPDSTKYQGLKREKFKKWFNDNLQIIESLNVFDYWANENQEQVDGFIINFKKSYNTIAKRILNPEI